MTTPAPITPAQATTVLQTILSDAEGIITAANTLSADQVAAVQAVGTATAEAINAMAVTSPAGPVFDAVASGSAGVMGGTTVTDTHTATAGATVLAFVNVGGGRAVSAITYGGTAMTPVGSVAFDIDASVDGNVFVFELANAPAGPQTVSVTLSGFCIAALATVSYTGVTSVGTPSTVTGTGTSASQALTCLANQVIVEAIASQTAIISEPTGGTNRALVSTANTNTVDIVRLAVSDSTTSTTFGATITSTTTSATSPWGAIGVVLS
jgi:hypothetical protein